MRRSKSRAVGGSTCRIDAEDRIGLLGANGNGKSTLAKLHDRRAARADVRRRCGGPSGWRSPSSPSTSSTNSAAGEPGRASARLMPDAPRRRCAPASAQMGFPDERRWIRRRASSPAASGRGCCSASPPSAVPNLLILDEPTNHLDIDSREALVRALNDFPGAVILISHDRHLIEASVDRLLLVADGAVKPFDGDMEDYRRLILEGPEERWKRRSRAADTKPGKSASAQDRRREQAQRRAELAPLSKKDQGNRVLDRTASQRASSSRHVSWPTVISICERSSRRPARLATSSGPRPPRRLATAEESTGSPCRREYESRGRGRPRPRCGPDRQRLSSEGGRVCRRLPEEIAHDRAHASMVPAREQADRLASDRFSPRMALALAVVLHRGAHDESNCVPLPAEVLPLRSWSSAIMVCHGLRRSSPCGGGGPPGGRAVSERWC